MKAWVFFCVFVYLFLNSVSFDSQTLKIKKISCSGFENIVENEDESLKYENIL